MFACGLFTFVTATSQQSYEPEFWGPCAFYRDEHAGLVHKSEETRILITSTCEDLAEENGLPRESPTLEVLKEWFGRCAEGRGLVRTIGDG